MNKLLLIQSELKVPKNNFNDFGNYSFRSCEDILEHLKPILKKHNCILILSDEVVNMSDRFYVKATAKLIDIETKEESIAVGWAREDNEKKKFDSSQLTGSASSYARKYALNGLLLIDDVKDSDYLNKGDNSGNNKADNKPAPKKAQKDTKIDDLANELRQVYTKISVELTEDNIKQDHKDKYNKTIEAWKNGQVSVEILNKAISFLKAEYNSCFEQDDIPF